jgi:hypothetical protein
MEVNNASKHTSDSQKPSQWLDNFEPNDEQSRGENADLEPTKPRNWCNIAPPEASLMRAPLGAPAYTIVIRDNRAHVYLLI